MSLILLQLYPVNRRLPRLREIVELYRLNCRLEPRARALIHAIRRQVLQDTLGPRTLDNLGMIVNVLKHPPQEHE